MGDDLTTELVCQVTGVNRHYLEHLIREGYLVPARRGKTRRTHRFSVMQVVAVSYGMAFKRAGCNPYWTAEAIRYVSGLSVADLLRAFQEGRTLLSLAPPEAAEQSRLVAPNLKPNATREQRVMVQNLDLRKCYERTLRDLHALVGVERTWPPETFRIEE